jgi:hypothetical protein
MSTSAERTAVPAEFASFKVSDGYRWYVVWLLFIVYVFNFVDRQILQILIEPIRKEFNFSDGQMGLLSGLAFAVLYSVLGIPIARFADRAKRVNIIAASLFTWSLFTVLTGRAPSRGWYRRGRMYAPRVLDHFRLFREGEAHDCDRHLFDGHLRRCVHRLLGRRAGR